MSHDPPHRPPKDPKTEIEDQLVTRAAEPWNKVLDPAEREGLRIFLNLFVKTHPAMRSLVDRRVEADAAVEAAQVATTPPEATAPDASGVVAKDGAGQDPTSTDPRAAAEGSGIVAKDRPRGGRAKGKAGGER